MLLYLPVAFGNEIYLIQFHKQQLVHQMTLGRFALWEKESYTDSDMILEFTCCPVDLRCNIIQ